MSDVLLLRFRDLVRPEEAEPPPQELEADFPTTVKRHNDVTRSTGKSSLWGWWKKPLEVNPILGLTMMRNACVDQGQQRVLLLDSASKTLFEAPLFNAHFDERLTAIAAPRDDWVPEYYRGRKCEAWFEVGLIIKSSSTLADFVWSKHNRTVEENNSSGLQESQIGQAAAGYELLASNVSLWLLTPIDDIGLIRRGEFVRPIDLGHWPVRSSRPDGAQFPRTKVLHLSDLHFGKGHAFRV